MSGAEKEGSEKQEVKSRDGAGRQRTEGRSHKASKSLRNEAKRGFEQRSHHTIAVFYKNHSGCFVEIRLKAVSPS